MLLGTAKWRTFFLRRYGLISAVTAVGILLAWPAAGQNRSIGNVFRDFETICFSYAEQGYSIDVRASIDQAGFQYLQKTNDGEDGYSLGVVQLIIGRKGCAFGMPELPFAQMSEWTTQWANTNGLEIAQMTINARGGQYWVWDGQDFSVTLEEGEFPGGTPMSGLILTRE